MPTRLRKARKLRGSRTVGWGQVGQHRKHGAKGGYGRAGRHKHKWSWVVKYQPDYFGSHGFYNPTVRKVERWVNVGQLEELAGKYAKDNLLDLHALGIDKLLGSGEITAPITVKVASFSSLAKSKVEKAGGKVIPLEGV
ncbi:MAG: uL15 family ribosomal protein [Conexivisphaerales archaeon]